MLHLQIKHALRADFAKNEGAKKNAGTRPAFSH